MEKLDSNTSAYAPYLHELGHKYYYDSIEKLAKIYISITDFVGC